MKMLLVLTVMVCVSGALAEGPIPKIELTEAIKTEISPSHLQYLELLNGDIERVNGMLDMKKWTDLLSTKGEAGKDVLGTLEGFISTFVKGDYTRPEAIGHVAYEAEQYLLAVQNALSEVTEVPGVRSLDEALTSMNNNLSPVVCLIKGYCSNSPF